MRILVIRAGALGDVLLTTPIVARLRKTFPEATIDVCTGCPQAYEGNQHISSLVGNPQYETYDRTINLNMVYEDNPSNHIVDIYMKRAFGDTLGTKRVVYGILPPPPADMIRESNIVTIHGTRSWASRSMSAGWYEEVIDRLLALGFRVSVLGGGGDFQPVPRDGVTNLVGKTSLRDTANEIASSRCFIASDSGLLHLAGCTDTPIVGLFTSVRSEYRLPYRHNTLGWNCVAVWPKDLDCYGCHAEIPGRTYVDCKRKDNACASRLSVEDVIGGVLTLCRMLPSQGAPEALESVV